jgi:drug/metabolite transporter (DMT)-like permease
MNNFSRGMLFLILAQCMVGTGIVVSKLLLGSIPVLTLLAIRFTLATLILLPLHWTTATKADSLKNHFSKLHKKDYAFLLAQALCAGLFFNVLMLTGLNFTNANVAGIITSALPAIIAIASWLVLGEKISIQKSLCVIFATAGLIIIAYDKFTGTAAPHSFFGDFVIFLSLLPEAAYYILCKFYSSRLPLFLTAALMNGINALFLFPIILFSTPALLHISTINWFLLFIVGLSSGLFYVFWLMGSARVDGIMTSLSTAMMPVATVIIAWAILGERLTHLELLGMSLVMLSILSYARQ